MSNKKPVVAIDCDGIICDNIPTWDRYFAQNNCGVNHGVEYDPADWFRYDKLCKVCWEKVLTHPDLLYVVPPRPDSAEWLSRLSEEFELYFVTSRPDSIKPVTENWLKWNGLHSQFKEIVFSKNKRAFCESVGAIALLDDSTNNLNSLEGSGVHPICWDFPYNQDFKGSIRIHSWREAYEAIKDVATGRVPPLKQVA